MTPTDPAASPRTAAGREFLELLESGAPFVARREFILAIEQEAASLAAPGVDVEALAGALDLFIADPMTFATDPDGDCWFCGDPTDPIEDHDEEGSECPVSMARALIQEGAASAEETGRDSSSKKDPA